MKMKVAYPNLGIKIFCQLFGKTRHAYYDALQRSRREELKDDLILQLVKIVRKELPRLGTRKLQDKLQEYLTAHKLEVGRDYLFDLLN